MSDMENISKTPRTVIMCPPAFYEIPAIENSSMDPDDQPEPARAWKQWVAIRNLYTKLGLTVYDMEPEPRFWDMIFTANGAWGASRARLGDAEYVLSNYRQPIRRGEKEFFKKILKSLGKNVFELPDNVFFEGQGDAIALNGYLLLGHGSRSSPEVGEYLRRMLLPTRPVVYLKLAMRDKFYHLDTCLMSLRGTEKEGVIYYPAAFNDEGNEKIQNLYKVEKLKVHSSLADEFVCNSAFVDDTFLLNVSFGNYSEESFELSALGRPIEDKNTDVRFKELVRYQPEYFSVIYFVEKLGYKVIPVYTSEFKKSGAGVRCLTLFVD
ncbi:MAG: hypothetical protein WDZ40_03910 [Candidatus Spechtbacterales bacterium]